MQLRDRDVYDFFQTQEAVPSRADLSGLKRGPSMILGLEGPEQPDAVLRMCVRQRYPAIVAKVNTPEVISFWFGKS